LSVCIVQRCSDHRDAGYELISMGGGGAMFDQLDGSTVPVVRGSAFQALALGTLRDKTSSFDENPSNHDGSFTHLLARFEIAVRS
jgi:hypothetical protein